MTKVTLVLTLRQLEKPFVFTHMTELTKMTLLTRMRDYVFYCFSLLFYTFSYMRVSVIIVMFVMLIILKGFLRSLSVSTSVIFVSSLILGFFMPVEKMSPAAFAEKMKWSKSYVSQLKAAGRLVTEPKGKRVLVLVAESLALIDETGDLNRVDVKDRHAKDRGQGTEAQPEATEEVLSANVSQAVSKSQTELYKAKSAKLNYEREAGLVVETDVVIKAAVEVATFVRSSLENLPDQLAPELAAISDQAQIHAVLVEHFEQLLSDASQQMMKMSEVK